MSGRKWVRRVLSATISIGMVATTGAVVSAEGWDYSYGSPGPLDYSEYLEVLPLADDSTFLVGAFSGNFEGLSAGVNYRTFAQYRAADGTMVWTEELPPSLGGCVEPPELIHAA